MLTLFWFRRDLRLSDNAGLYEALKNSGSPVLPVFIFDTEILSHLDDKADRRVEFIYDALSQMQSKLGKLGSSLLIQHGKSLAVFQELVGQYPVSAVYTNHDYEPYARQRDSEVSGFLSTKDIVFKTFKDQTIFEKDEILSNSDTPYTVFTPYSRKWKSQLNDFYLRSYPTETYFQHFYKTLPLPFPALSAIGFEATGLPFPGKALREDLVQHYAENRNFPGLPGTSRLSVHLRFGTVSVRQIARQALPLSETFLNELIWRDFYMMILYHFPQVAGSAFRPAYNHIAWRNDEKEFEQWCAGKTGYPLVDAGMRELNATGFMHNRVRMVVASFLVKHLLIDWRWGEAYFAGKLLDYDLAANNGGWQWAAGSGTDAAPYFRIFNPTEQAKKFDPQLAYIKKWIPELGGFDYPLPIVAHTFARERVLKVFKEAVGKVSEGTNLFVP